MASGQSPQSTTLKGVFLQSPTTLKAAVAPPAGYIRLILPTVAVDEGRFGGDASCKSETSRSG